MLWFLPFHLYVNVSGVEPGIILIILCIKFKSRDETFDGYIYGYIHIAMNKFVSLI